MDSVNDIRLALRRLMSAPGYTAAVLITLALTIGANAAMFSAVDAVLLRPMAIRDLDRVVIGWGTDPSENLPVVELSYRNIEHIAAHSQSLTHVAAVGSTSWPVVLEGEDRPLRLASAGVSASFFDTLGVRLAPSFLICWWTRCTLPSARG
jgi:putative ABC transport system permease protein